jgi:hypothetical protein
MASSLEQNARRAVVLELVMAVRRALGAVGKLEVRLDQIAGQPKLDPTLDRAQPLHALAVAVRPDRLSLIG